MHNNLEPMYCSLDLELTGFDPTKDEILEVGFVFFSITNAGIAIHKQWSQVFKPVREVHPKIFGLTGIRPIDLEQAPRFSEYREFLQKELGEAVLVGHSISVDVRFLEAFGVHLSGQSIDTLDLVQFILPTHHSYNLENLMHIFQVPHPEAHRASADAHATIIVLEKLLQTFAGFPEDLRQQVQDWAMRGKFFWSEMLLVNLSPLDSAGWLAKTSPSQSSVSAKNLPINTIVTFPLGARPEDMLLGQNGTLVIVPHNYQMLEWWKQGLVQGLVSSDDAFNEGKFNQLLFRNDLTSDQIKFVLKILVWKNTNWQTKTIIDLNLSFFGGQYRPLISGGAMVIPDAADIICCSHQTFLRLKSKILAQRTIIIYDLGQFERSVMVGMGDRASWSHMAYILKSLYNPETQTGENGLRDVVTRALADTDLFFGLVALDVHKRFPTNTYIGQDALSADLYAYERMVRAADHYASQLDIHNRKLRSSAITRFATALRSFFSEQDGRVRWIESGENRCVFLNLPLDITASVKNAIGPYKNNVFVDDCGNKEVVSYLQTRLGLTSYPTVAPSGILDVPEKKVSCMINFQRASDATIMDLVKRESLPALALYENPSDIKEFYKKHYSELKEYATVFAQDYSGGGNKMFRNFSINRNSVMLASPEYINKTLATHLAVKSLIWIDFSLERLARNPYEEALISSFNDQGIKVSEIFKAQSLWGILKACYTPQLERIFIYTASVQHYQQEQLVDSLGQLKFLDISLV